MSTLECMERVKHIHTHAKINETSQDPAFVLDLQRQILFLKESVSTANDKFHVRELESKNQSEHNDKMTADTASLQDEIER
jgi:hypothetical protein